MISRVFSILILSVTVVVMGFGGVDRDENVQDSADKQAWQTAYGDSWTLACIPSAERGKIVDVYRVVTELGQDVRIVKIGLENRGDRDISRLSFGWQIYKRQNPSDILLAGESQMLAVPVKAGKRVLATYTLLSLSDLSWRLSKEGSLSGDYRTEVSVREIEFAKRSYETQQSPFMRRASYGTAAESAVSFQECSECLPVEDDPGSEGAGGACANKVCKLVPRKGGWTCDEPLAGYKCSVSADRKNCSDSRCN